MKFSAPLFFSALLSFGPGTVSAAEGVSCDEGGCNQFELEYPSCDGGNCNQKDAFFPTCDGGGCDQSGTKNPTCDGGECCHFEAFNASCGGICDSSFCSGSDMDSNIAVVEIDATVSESSASAVGTTFAAVVVGAATLF